MLLYEREGLPPFDVPTALIRSVMIAPFGASPQAPLVRRGLVDRHLCANQPLLFVIEREIAFVQFGLKRLEEQIEAGTIIRADLLPRGCIGGDRTADRRQRKIQQAACPVASALLRCRYGRSRSDKS